MSSRAARTVWDGDLERGSGRISLLDFGSADLPVTFYGRTGDDPKATTGPEELLAAAHATDYAMHLSARVAQAGGSPDQLVVNAVVGLGPDPDGGFRITSIGLTVSGRVSHLATDTFARVAQDASTSYPLAKSTREVPIALETAVEENL